MLQLQLMNQEDYDKYLVYAISNYTNELITSGISLKEEAADVANKTFHQILPEGLKTDGHFLFNIVNEHNEKIGMIWYGFRREEEGFIFDVVIEPSFQHQGFGTQTMKLVEEHAKEHGIKRLTLHVFGHNKNAIGLYQKMGYEPYSIDMAKNI